MYKHNGHALFTQLANEARRRTAIRSGCGSGCDSETGTNVNQW